MNAEQVERLRERAIGELRMADDAADEETAGVINHLAAGEGRLAYVPLREKADVARTVFNSIRRLDILQELLDDEKITEIMVNGTVVFVEEDGRIRKWEKEFTSTEVVENLVQRIAGRCNRIVNTRQPMTDARLEDGSRVHMIIPPASVDGPVITIRRFPQHPIRMQDLLAWKSITGEAADFLICLVKAGYNLFVSGGTGSGKTTFLNVLSGYIPVQERVVVIEDNAELQIRGLPNLVRLEARGKNLEGENEITIRTLVRAALRMRPNRIIIGEVRGEEAIDLLQSMNTGHDGSLSTGHANSTRDMLSRLETMVLMGMDIPMEAIRRQIASGIDILVHLGRLRDGSRRVLEISEMLGVQGEIQIQPLFAFEEQGEAEDGRVLGRLQKKKELFHREKLLAAGISLGTDPKWEEEMKAAEEQNPV